MTITERLELLATARVGHCALLIAAECGETNAFAVYSGSIRALVSAAASLDFESARSMLREIEREIFVPAEAKQSGRKLYVAVSNTAEVVRA